MRIRKHASKLLGSASVFPYAPPPPPPPPANPWSWPAHASALAGGVVCELNRSPWDVMLLNTNPKEEEDGEERGIMGNDIKAEEEEPMTAITSTAAELTIKDMKERKEKKVKKRKKRKEMEIKTSAATADEIIMTCKKSDGKGWQCKRPAQPQHSLCNYHLTQLRSYNSNHSHRVHNTAAGANGRNLRTKALAAVADEAGGGGSNFYYYYYGFGPWRGKRRGDGKANEGQEGSGGTSGSGNGYDAPILAADDEYDPEGLDEDDDDDDDSVDDKCYYENGKREGEEKRTVLKKRGRKPVKARSLKSLL